MINEEQIKKIKNNIATFILREKNKKRLTCQEISLETEIPLSTLNMIMNAKMKNVSIQAVIGLADYFGVEIKELLGYY